MFFAAAFRSALTLELLQLRRSPALPALASTLFLCAAGLAFLENGVAGPTPAGGARVLLGLSLAVVYLAALTGVVQGVSSLTAEGAGWYLMAPAFRHGAVLGAKVTAAGLVISGGLALGLAGAGLLLSFQEAWRALPALWAVGTIVGADAAALGALCAAWLRRRPAALLAGLAVWVFASLIYDLMAVGLGLALPPRAASGAVLVLLAANPVEAGRAVALVATGALAAVDPNPFAGPALERSFPVWAALPPALAGWGAVFYAAALRLWRRPE